VRQKPVHLRCNIVRISALRTRPWARVRYYLSPPSIFGQIWDKIEALEKKESLVNLNSLGLVFSICLSRSRILTRTFIITKGGGDFWILNRDLYCEFWLFSPPFFWDSFFPLTSKFAAGGVGRPPRENFWVYSPKRFIFKALSPFYNVFFLLFHFLSLTPNFIFFPGWPLLCDFQKNHRSPLPPQSCKTVKNLEHLRPEITGGCPPPLLPPVVTSKYKWDDSYIVMGVVFGVNWAADFDNAIRF